MATAAVDRLRARRPHMALRARLRTTPGRLRLAAGVLALAAIAFGIAMATAAASREQAADAVATGPSRCCWRPTASYASLVGRRCDRHHDLPDRGARARRASSPLSGRSRVGQRAADALTEQWAARPRPGPRWRRWPTRLPVYSGLIEAARANNRQGLPVGAAYLRRGVRDHARRDPARCRPAVRDRGAPAGRRLPLEHVGDRLRRARRRRLAARSPCSSSRNSASRGSPTDPQRPARAGHRAARGRRGLGARRLRERAERALRRAAQGVGLRAGAVGRAFPRPARAARRGPRARGARRRHPGPEGLRHRHAHAGAGRRRRPARRSVAARRPGGLDGRRRSSAVDPRRL